MRILILSNFYPPYTIGGMENRCREVELSLSKRGHDVRVLTSTFKLHKRMVEKNIYRILALESDLYSYRPIHFFLYHNLEERQNIDALNKILQDFQPDLAFIWGMWNLSRHLPYFLENSWQCPVVYSMADAWPARPSTHSIYWDLPVEHSFLKPAKKILGKLAKQILQDEPDHQALRFEHAIFASHSLREELAQKGISFRDTRVIYPGIDIEIFATARKRAHKANGCLSLLYAGNVVEHKGVHTAVEAMAVLERKNSRPSIELTIVGSGLPSYEERLHRIVNEYGLNDRVHFRPQIPREQMPELLESHQALLFPSIYEEPFARIVIEAMASGLPVIGTTSGGTKEILVDGETGLTFQAGDAQELAQKIQLLHEEPQLYNRLSDNGRRRVAADFSLDKMVNAIEAYLVEVLQQA